MMKKRIALLLVMMMAGGMAAGCAKTSGDDVAEGESVQVESEAQEAEEEGETQEAEEVSETEDFDFEELTLIDIEECVVKITSIGMETNGYGDEILALTVYTENKSADRNCEVDLTVWSVNGLVNITGDYSSSEILPQKKANGKVEISMEELEEYGVTDVTDIYVTCEVEDSEDDEIWATQSAHVYPYGEENAVAYNRDAQESDVIFADNEYLTGIVTRYELVTDDYSGIEAYTVELFFQNPSDQYLQYEILNTYINEHMIELEWYYQYYLMSQLYAGDCRYLSLNWYKSDFDDNGIEAIESFGFTYSVSGEEEELIEETVTVTLE